MVHEAGGVDGDEKQRCRRCGTVLKDLRIRRSNELDNRPPRQNGGEAYPEGAMVEVHETWQAMSLFGRATCR